MVPVRYASFGNKHFLLKLNYCKKVFFPHPFICQWHNSIEKLGNRKNQAHFYYFSFKSWILGGHSFFDFQCLLIKLLWQINGWVLLFAVIQLYIRCSSDLPELSTFSSQNTHFRKSFFTIDNHRNLSNIFHFQLGLFGF